MYIPWFIKRVYLGGVNQRNVVTLALNFALNFSPIFVWLFMFKNAGIIPKSWRPRIWGGLAYYSDVFLFGDYWRTLESKALFAWSLCSSFVFAAVCTVIVPALAWYQVYYRKRLRYNVFDETASVMHYPLQRDGRVAAFNPGAARNALPFVFLFFAFAMLNVDHLLARQGEAYFTKFKDLLAWTLYVIMHLTGPILTGVYLYVFQPPGTLKCFSFAMGLQNILGLLTHLLLPMAPPWFINLYGAHDTAHLNYDQAGYAAGLTRVDTHLGTHMNSNGFHISPIVFGAVPSLHSAMATQCFFFLIQRSTCTKSMASDLLPAQDQDRGSRGSTPSVASTSENSVEESKTADKTDGSADECPAEHADPLSLDIERLLPSSSVGVDCLAPILVENQRLPSSILNAKWLWVFHKGLVPKFLATLFLCLQWWATQYLDHHFRFDLFVGVLYAVFAFQIINVYVLQPKVLKPWLKIRTNPALDSKNEAKTMGMRVFENTKIEWFFDPLA